MRTLAVILGTAGMLSSLHCRPNEPVLTDSSLIQPGIPESIGELSPAVQAYLARGDTMRTTLRFVDAEREYRRAAQVARTEGHLPSRTMWLLANIHYNHGDLQNAAAVLDELAAEAAGFGDIVVEARAVFYAAWINDEAGYTSAARSRVTRLEKLLRSPYMPLEHRNYLAARLETRRDLVAKR